MPDSLRPLIAIVGELTAEESPRITLRRSYPTAVRRAGGLPVVWPYLEDPELLEAVDGVLFAGSDDFETESLGLGPTHPHADPVPGEKQALDLALAREVVAREIPVLGICYGMQLLALAEGAGIHQHLPEDRPGSRNHGGGVRHEVAVEGGTKLRDVLGVASLTVISRHHQAISGVGPDWLVSGYDDEGLIEAVERRRHPFALGVQWHPEADEEDRVNERLFDGLVRAAREHARSRSTAEGAPLS